MPSITGRTIAVNAGDDLQAALNSAQFGDEVVLQAGAVFTGGYSLPKKTGSGWIVVRTAGTPTTPGVRVLPSTSAGFAKIQANTSAPPLRTAYNVAAVSGWRVVNVELRPASSLDTSVNPLFYVVHINHEDLPNTLANQHRDVILDRCYIHGNGKQCVWGVRMEAQDSALIDCYVSGIAASGFESKAWGSIHGNGPLLARNNHLESHSINVLLGPATGATIQPEDVQIIGNHLYKRPSWRTGGPAGVKNWFEKKSCARLEFRENYCENNWADGQVGWGVVLNVNGYGANLPGNDTYIAHNVFAKSTGMFTFQGVLDAQPGIPPMERTCVYGNLMLDIDDFRDPVAVARRYAFNLQSFNHDLILAYNSAPQFGADLDVGGFALLSRSSTAPESRGIRLTMHGNLGRLDTYGVFGIDNVSGFGENGLTNYADQWQGAGNVLEGADATNYPTAFYRPSSLTGADYIDTAGGNFELVNGTSYTFGGQKVGYLHGDTAAARAARSAEVTS